MRIYAASVGGYRSMSEVGCSGVESVPAAFIDALPALVDIVGPETLEPGDDGHAIVTRQHLCESRHDTAKRDPAIRDRVVEHLERVVPGMRSAVERRRIFWINRSCMLVDYIR